MRVGFDARWYNDSGVGTYVAGLLRALTEHAPDLDLVVYESIGNRVPALDDQRVQRVSLRSAKYSANGQAELALRCRLDHLDLFHSPFYPIPLLAGCPTVVTIHDLIPFLFPIASAGKQWLVKMGYRVAAVRASHIVAVSQTTARDIENILGVPGKRISVVHNAVSSDHFRAEPEPDELDDLHARYGIRPPYVMTPAPRNWRTKNCATAHDVLESVRRSSAARFQTVLYGPGSDPPIKAASRDILHVGFVPAHDLGQLLRHAHAFLLTSLYEGFGLPLLEAMSCGCPVVSSNGGALAEIAGTGAQLFVPFDVEGLSSAINGLLNDDACRRHWRARARDRAKDFSWKKAAMETAAAYRRVCGLHPVHGPNLSYTHDPYGSRS